MTNDEFKVFDDVFRAIPDCAKASIYEFPNKGIESQIPISDDTQAGIFMYMVCLFGWIVGLGKNCG
jgi:hypothetical protein